MTTLTAKETEMLTAFIAEGADCNGAECAQDILDDNMTWLDAEELCEALGWDAQTVGGVMSSLEAKGMISDSAEPHPSKPNGPNAWTATDAGIEHGWPHYAVDF